MKDGKINQLNKKKRNVKKPKKIIKKYHEFSSEIVELNWSEAGKDANISSPTSGIPLAETKKKKKKKNKNFM